MIKMQEALEFEDWVFNGVVPDPIDPVFDGLDEDDFEPYQSDGYDE